MREVTVERLAAPLRAGGLADSVYERAGSAPGSVQFSLAPTAPSAPWTPVTALRFKDEVLAVAKGFVAEGLRRGDRVALMSRTRYEWTLLAYALWSMGAEVVPVYPTSSTEQLRWVLYDCSVRAVVVENGGHAMTVAAACDADTQLVGLWQMDLGCVEELADLGLALDDDTVHRMRAEVCPQDTALIGYTSGTTGTPKGCVITHANLASECDNLIHGWSHILALPGEEPAVLSFLPVAHCYGAMVVVSCVRGGIRLGHQPEMHPAELLPALSSFRPTFLYAVPYIFEKIFDKARRAAEDAGHGPLFDRAMESAVHHAETQERHSMGLGHGPGPVQKVRHAVYDRMVYGKLRAVLGGRVRNAVSGGSTLRRELGLFFAGAGVTVYDGYGLTETTAAITAQPPGAVRFGTVGRPLPGSSVHIARDGEVWVRGDTVFSGYLNNPGATEAVLDRGWFATGDTGRLDDGGYLVITGRKKDIIVTSGGKSVSPLVLEEQLLQHPMVSQCLVVGDNRPYIAALITVDPEALEHWHRLKGKKSLPIGSLTEDEDLREQIQRAVTRANTRVSRAESIRAFRILPQEFSLAEGLMTPSLKLRRTAIVQTYASDIEALYGRS